MSIKGMQKYWQMGKWKKESWIVIMDTNQRVVLLCIQTTRVQTDAGDGCRSYCPYHVN